jgi:hypothetical protein
MAELLRATENSKLGTANHILPSWGAAVLRPYKIALRRNSRASKRLLAALKFGCA